MPKQLRTPLNLPSRAAQASDGAMKRNIAQSFSVEEPDDGSNETPSADDLSRQLVEAKPLPTHDRFEIADALGVDAAEEPSCGMVLVPAAAVPARGSDDTSSLHDEEWKSFSDVSYSSEDYLPGESPFDPPNSYPSGFGHPPPPQVTEQQKVAIDMILCGKKLKTIAEHLKIHPGTLWRWRRHDLDFRRALRLASQLALFHAAEELRELIPKAVDVIHSEVEKGNHHAAIQLLRLLRRDLKPFEVLAE